MKAAAMQKFKVFERKARGEVCCCLNTPLKFGTGAHETLGDRTGTIKINQKVIVHDPQHLQVVSAAQVYGLFDKLFGGQGIPLASVDACIRAITTVIGAGETRGIHRPSFATDTLVCIEVGEVVSLRRHVYKGSE